MLENSLGVPWEDYNLESTNDEMDPMSFIGPSLLGLVHWNVRYRVLRYQAFRWTTSVMLFPVPVVATCPLQPCHFFFCTLYQVWSLVYCWLKSNLLLVHSKWKILYERELSRSHVRAFLEGLRPEYTMTKNQCFWERKKVWCNLAFITRKSLLKRCIVFGQNGMSLTRSGL